MRTEWECAVGYWLELHSAAVEGEVGKAWAGEDVH